MDQVACTGSESYLWECNFTGTVVVLIVLASMARGANAAVRACAILVLAVC